MKRNLTFLGIETSCDETAASIVRETDDGLGEILSNIVSSQVEVHKEFGGVVPDLAARAHVEKIEFIINIIGILVQYIQEICRFLNIFIEFFRIQSWNIRPRVFKC